MNDTASQAVQGGVDRRAARLAALREAMSAAGVAAVVVPSADPHLSEYLPEHWQARAWLSGFTGSMATLVVSVERAALWTDSRYWEQAERELAGSGITLMRLRPGGETHVEWLAGHLAPGAVAAVDGMVCGVLAARQLREAFAPRDIVLRTDLDLPGAIWQDRPALPEAAVYAARAEHPMRATRLARLAETLRERDVSWHLISTLDDIAWLFDLRGADVAYNPVFLAHALVRADGSATLFVAPGKIAPALAAQLAEDGVTLAPYEAVARALAALPAGAALLYEPRRTVVGLLAAALGDGRRMRAVEALNPTTLFKACKDESELAQVRETMIEDGVALCEFFADFEAALSRGETLTELSVDAWLGARRAARPGHVSPSFATIAGFNANGAMPHYRATEAAHARLNGDGLLLIDSGSQYRGGTTDITRMVPVGQPDTAQRRDCTLVLKGLIALSRAHFPAGLRAPLLDAIARAPLWAAGLDYGHGTGHGVGFFLNVHEGPQSISYHTPAEPHTAMRAGMITSIEPGLYRPGQWGVRIENLVAAQPAGSGEFGAFLRFETLTLCPIDTRCLETALLDAGERDWLNAYHAMVRERLAPRLSGAALDWLLARTAALPEAVPASGSRSSPA